MRHNDAALIHSRAPSSDRSPVALALGVATLAASIALATPARPQSPPADPLVKEGATLSVARHTWVIPDGDVAGIVAFGKEALVERLPSDLDAIDRIASTPVRSASDVGAEDRSKQKVENRKNGKTPVCADLSLLHVEVGACDAFWV